MTELAVRGGNALALESDATFWNEHQLATLRQIGLEKVGEGDLQVFHHVCQRSGLDPFARQIYMIARKANEFDEESGQWRKVDKFTIQTGIDGFRLIGRRAANKAKHRVALDAPLWGHEDGTWRPVWRAVWGSPVAAKVTIRRDGEPFEAVALFDEYCQRNDRGPTGTWKTRPAGMLAKCAEALAWRMAFPQDLSGIYTDDEMANVDAPTVQGTVVEPQTAAERMAAIVNPHAGVNPLAGVDTEPVDGELIPEGPAETGELITDHTRKHMFALLNKRTKDRDEQIAGINTILGTQITSRSELTEAQAQDVVTALAATEGASS